MSDFEYDDPKDPDRFEEPLDTGASKMGRYDEFQQVNKSPRRVDSMKLALGRGTFTDDTVPPDALVVKMLWSPHAHANIVSIDASEAERMPGVACVLHTFNTERIPYTTAGQGHPEPSPYDMYVFPRRVRYVGDRVCAVAAETERQAALALQAIRVEYQVLPAVFDPEAALAPGAPLIHDEPESTGIHDPKRNLAAYLHAEVGDVEQGFRKADHVLTRTYRVNYAQQAPIEPHVAVTWLDEDNRLQVKVATQVPFHSRRILARILQIPIQRIRVIKPRIGGGFGSKQEILLEDVPALVTLRTRRPARFCYTRAEELVSSRSRHPQILRMRLGVNKDGTLEAMEMKVVANTGSYGAHALTVQSCTGGKALPLYRAQRYLFDCEVAYTNLPNAGAFRGYGGPQGFFALEILMDEAADLIGMDPLELRRKNVLRSGDDDPLAVSLGEGAEGFPQRIRSCAMPECISLGAEAIGWDQRASLPRTGRYRRGMGMVCLMHGSGIPGVDMAASFLKLNEDGSFNLLAGATDIGTGSDTMLSQVAAEALKTSVDKIIIYSSDTDLTPFDKGAYASSTTFISGNAVRKASEKCLRQILGAAASIWGITEEQLHAKDGHVLGPGGRSLSYGEICLSTMYQQNQHQIMDHASHVAYDCPPPFAAHFCEVEVDTETGGVKLLRYVAAVDCGVAIHVQGAEGQTEGGCAQGMGWGVTERFVFDADGRMVNTSFADYNILSALDMPDFRTIIAPSYEPTGPFGAKSVSEIPIDGPAPCIANAIHDAIGVRFREIPITPEKVWRALREAGTEAAG